MPIHNVENKMQHDHQKIAFSKMLAHEITDANSRKDCHGTSTQWIMK